MVKRYFSDKISGFEQCPSYKAFRTFFDVYLVERDYEKTLSFMEDDFYSFGTGGDEVAADKAEFVELLRAIETLEYIQNPIK